MHSLAARLALGEESAFAELYDACAERLHRYLTVRLRSQEAAADVLQATFLRAVSHRRSFRRVENPVAYLFQMARNEVARSMNRQQRWQEQPLLSTELVQSGASPSQSDEAEIIAAALDRVADKDRELIELKIFAGLTFREIAELTKLPQGTVATRYRRALEELRPWLTRQLS